MVCSNSRKSTVINIAVVIVCVGFASLVIFSKNISTKLTQIKPKFLDGNLFIKSASLVLPQSVFEGYNNLSLCPDIPPNLRSNVQPEERWRMYKDDPSVLQYVQLGGSYQPPDCRASQHTAIVIPYRDREDHLHKLLVHLHQFLQKQNLYYRVFVAEMAGPTTFNTGMMQNVGFDMADKTDNFTCFIIHDVDLLPTNENNLYKCDDKMAVHIATNNSKYKYRKLYEGYFGGVVALTRDQYYRTNGFSNLYFGWGSQDDDFRNRVLQSGVRFRDVPMNVGVVEALPHERDKGNPVNEGRMEPRTTAVSNTLVEYRIKVVTTNQSNSDLERQIQVQSLRIHNLHEQNCKLRQDVLQLQNLNKRLVEDINLILQKEQVSNDDDDMNELLAALETLIMSYSDHCKKVSDCEAHLECRRSSHQRLKHKHITLYSPIQQLTKNNVVLNKLGSNLLNIYLDTYDMKSACYYSSVILYTSFYPSMLFNLLQQCNIQTQIRQCTDGLHASLTNIHVKLNAMDERGKYARSSKQRMKKEGLNTLQYKVLKQELRDLYTWILVEVDQEQVMKGW